MGVSQKWCFVRETRIKMDDLGVPLFLGNPHIHISTAAHIRRPTGVSDWKVLFLFLGLCWFLCSLAKCYTLLLCLNHPPPFPFFYYYYYYNYYYNFYNYKLSSQRRNP